MSKARDLAALLDANGDVKATNLDHAALVDMSNVSSLPSNIVSTLRGDTGPQGAAGPQGVAGADSTVAGPTGPTGSTGPAGANGSPDTAAQVLTKIKTVDGSGSGLDADLLDGQQASEFALSSHNHDSAYLGKTAKASDSEKIGYDSNSYSAMADASINIYTQSGNVQVGAMNSSHAHIYTDRPDFYFNKDIKVLGNKLATEAYVAANAGGGGVGGFETFTSSGTWNWAAAGSPANVWVCLQGGGGGAAREKYPTSAGGGAGGTIMWRKIAVSGNVSVTIGAAGSNNLQGIGGDKSTNAIGGAGGTTSFGGTSVGGGGGGSATSVTGGGSGGSATGSGAFTGMGGTSERFGMGGKSPFGSRGSGGSTSGTRGGFYPGTAVNPGAGLVLVAY